MATTRVYNLHGLKFGTSPSLGTPTQIVGPRTAGLRHGYRRSAASTDGVLARAAQMKGAYFGEWNITCEDVSSFVAQLSAWESATDGKRAIQFEGVEYGAATVQTGLIKRAVLTRASLAIRKDEVAAVNYAGRISADSASNSQDDEFACTAGATKTATIGSGKRAYRVHSVQHGGSLSVPTVLGFELNIDGEVAATSGDNDFGESVVVPQFDVTGKVTIQDREISTALTLAERLIDAAMGALAVDLRQQDGSTDTALTLANCRFFDIGDQWNSNGWANVEVMFGLEALGGAQGTTIYGLATGVNKLLTAA